MALTFSTPLMCSSCTTAVDESGLKVTWKEPHTVSEDSKHGRAFPKGQDASIAHIRQPDPHQSELSVPVLISQTHCVTESLRVTEDNYTESGADKTCCARGWDKNGGT